ncbi:MAG: hypothetical protein KGZ58_03340 [Ignavibacteriales bacterium]|nr:hypothetical protein [Ignavibacteriales bacterium]
MKEYNYIIWQEGKHYVSQCLDVEVSSFGETIDEAKHNLREAVELYFEGEHIDVLPMREIILGRELVNA